MNNKGMQPIYDNKNLTKAGSYDFDMVNAINKRSGEMKFDSTLPVDGEKKFNKHTGIIVLSIVCVIFIVLAITLPRISSESSTTVSEKKDNNTQPADTNFEAEDVMHNMECTLSDKRDGLDVLIKRKLVYNNNKLKKSIIEYTINVTKKEFANDSVYHNYMKKNFDFLIDTYDNVDGIDIKYSNEGSKYYYYQEIDLKKISTRPDYMDITDVYYNRNIDIVKRNIESQGLKCTKE